MQRLIRILCAGTLLLASSITSSPAQTASGTITIGFSGPLSGGAAAYGGDVQRGIQMGIDEVNADGGISVGGKKQLLKLVSLDDEYRPNETATNVKRLSLENGAPIIFVPHSGGVYAALGLNDKGPSKFIVAAYTSDPGILKQNNSLLLMIPPAFDEYFKPFGELEMKRFGKTLGLIPTTTAYGNAWTKGFSALWQANGGTVLSNNGVDYNTTTDFSTAVSKTLADKPDVIFVGGPSQPTALVMKAARDQGFTGGFIMMDQTKFDQVEQVLPLPRLEGAVGILPFRETPSAGLKTFVDAYTKKYGADRPPNPEIANNYETVHIFAEAIRLANSTDPVAINAKVHEAAANLAVKYSPIVTHGVDKTGHLIEEAFGAIVDHGKYVRIPIRRTE
ncbi:MAG: ABC transporter substrate-binding protein [Candidatus Velthaea sp.]|jgi:branched-chain amino acid transport system substrate-binding protein